MIFTRSIANGAKRMTCVLTRLGCLKGTWSRIPEDLCQSNILRRSTPVRKKHATADVFTAGMRVGKCFRHVVNHEIEGF